MTPRSEIYTPKQDDEHLHSFHMRSSPPPPPPPPGVLARKELLKTYGRCFVCLRKDHINRNCSAKFKCHNCKGRHHVSICQANLSPLQPTNPETPVPTPGPQQQCLTAQSESNGVVFHTNSATTVFLQAAQAIV